MTQQQQRPDALVATAAGAVAGQAPVPAGMRRIAVASAVGTMCEFYDFNIYGTAAALVFPHIFFPALGTAAGTAASFATLGVAFVARPFGSILFGHFGDRLGRKKTLIATLLTMGIATLLVGVMPTAAQIGVAAPILIVALRILQGLAAGGEYAGGVLFGVENAPKGKRGLWAMFPNLGGGGAIILANITFLVTAVFMPEAAFVSWGWRIPFLASIVLVSIGLWIRLKIDETPVFKNEVARAGISKVPFIEAFRSQPRRILLATGTAIGAVYVLTYIGGAYMTSYGTETLKLARTYVLTVAVAGGVAISLGVVAGAQMDDPATADPRFATMAGRCEHMDDLDAVVGRWTRTLTKDHLTRRLTDLKIPCAPVVTLPELIEDPHVRERGVLRTVTDDQGSFMTLGSPLFLSDSPIVEPTRPGELGADTDEVLAAELGMSADDIAKLRDAGVI